MNPITTTIFIIQKKYDPYSEMYVEIDSAFNENDAKRKAKTHALLHGEVRIIKETKTLEIIGKMINKG